MEKTELETIVLDMIYTNSKVIARAVKQIAKRDEKNLEKLIERNDPREALIKGTRDRVNSCRQVLRVLGMFNPEAQEEAFYGRCREFLEMHYGFDECSEDEEQYEVERLMKFLKQEAGRSVIEVNANDAG